MIRGQASDTIRVHARAGAAAAVLWRAGEPLLRRGFGHPYSDPELLTAFITRGRLQPLLDYVVQASGGAAFGSVFARLGGRGTARAVGASLGENAVLLSLSPLIDRYHPDVRDGTWPPLTRNPRAAAVSVTGHLLYAILLGLFTSTPIRPLFAGVKAKRRERRLPWRTFRLR